MQYSPKLKKVIAEIKAVIEKNDLAGFVCLVEPGNSEYLHVINPSFSAAFFDGREVRIKTKGLPLSPQEKSKLLSTTSNMLALLSTTVAQNGLSLCEVSQFIDKKIGAEHTDGTHTSQTELDN
jgi:hypothetical protein